MSKIKIHVRNNHWKKGFLPCDIEGEKHSAITKEEFEKGLSQYPEIKDKYHYCGPGNTYNEIYSILGNNKNLFVELSYDTWKEKLLNNILST